MSKTGEAAHNMRNAKQRASPTNWDRVHVRALACELMRALEVLHGCALSDDA